MMGEEVNYVTVTFRTSGVSACEKANDFAIYDNVRSECLALDTKPIIPENKGKAPLCPILHLVAAGLGILCVILLSLIIALMFHFNTVVSEQHRENSNLTAQNQQLRTLKNDLERKTEELTRKRDQLNWTMGVILEFDRFPVNTYCPHKECTPCVDGWVLFQSKCYLFSADKYSFYWMKWEESRKKCRAMNADLVVIDSQDEQEFINNHTKKYNDENGYWIGLSKDMENPWSWIDGSNLTVTYWTTSHPGYRVSCALYLPEENPLANWKKVSCEMKNRYICEMRSLIKL